MSSFTFDKKTKTPLSKQVYDAIYHAIANGDLKAGQRLIETDISRQMDISRGPVREAMKQLEKDGYLVSNPFRATIVAELHPDEVEEIFVPIRRIVELSAAIKAAETFGEKEFAFLERQIEKMKSAGEKENLEEISELDMGFHRFIINETCSPSVQGIWNMALNRIYPRFLLQGIKHINFQTVVDEHRTFLAIIKGGDAEEIRAHLDTHIT